MDHHGPGKGHAPAPLADPWNAFLRSYHHPQTPSQRRERLVALLVPHAVVNTDVSLYIGRWLPTPRFVRTAPLPVRQVPKPEAVVSSGIPSFNARIEAELSAVPGPTMPLPMFPTESLLSLSCDGAVDCTAWAAGHDPRCVWMHDAVRLSSAEEALVAAECGCDAALGDGVRLEDGDAVLLPACPMPPLHECRQQRNQEGGGAPSPPAVPFTSPDITVHLPSSLLNPKGPQGWVMCDVLGSVRRTFYSPRAPSRMTAAELRHVIGILPSHSAVEFAKLSVTMERDDPSLLQFIVDLRPDADFMFSNKSPRSLAFIVVVEGGPALCRFVAERFDVALCSATATIVQMTLFNVRDGQQQRLEGFLRRTPAWYASFRDSAGVIPLVDKTCLSALRALYLCDAEARSFT